jgi:hypothetical protein
LNWNRIIVPAVLLVQNDYVMHNVTTADVIQSKISILNQSKSLAANEAEEEHCRWVKIIVTHHLRVESARLVVQ